MSHQENDRAVEPESSDVQQGQCEEHQESLYDMVARNAADEMRQDFIRRVGMMKVEGFTIDPNSVQVTFTPDATS